MNNEQTSDLQSRLEALDELPSEPRPSGWSRRNWVQRDAIAFAAAAAAILSPKSEPAS